MYIYIELEKKLFYNKWKGMYFSLFEKVWFIRLLFIRILFDVYRWVWFWGFCDSFGFLNVIGWFRRRFVEGV